ncbi:uncharacterized protein LOC120421825 [Culex pipiens pallens]|uniref:uncharacterized protein LOC120421825 n=1 Tax=Culex pipiens pallens TaxID=42434 RepID=UPI00195324C8|nr:uncharacterized protein LOC120421825 [Culex pipiens pallens]
MRNNSSPCGYLTTSGSRSVLLPRNDGDDPSWFFGSPPALRRVVLVRRWPATRSSSAMMVLGQRPVVLFRHWPAERGSCPAGPRVNQPLVRRLWPHLVRPGFDNGADSESRVPILDSVLPSLRCFPSAVFLLARTMLATIYFSRCGFARLGVDSQLHEV